MIREAGAEQGLLAPRVDYAFDYRQTRATTNRISHAMALPPFASTRTASHPSPRVPPHPLAHSNPNLLVGLMREAISPRHQANPLPLRTPLPPAQPPTPLTCSRSVILVREAPPSASPRPPALGLAPPPKEKHNTRPLTCGRSVILMREATWFPTTPPAPRLPMTWGGRQQQDGTGEIILCTKDDGPRVLG